MKNAIASLGLTLAIFVQGVNAGAGEIEDQARALFDQYRPAVVTVTLVVRQKFSMQGRPSQENESKIDATGTVIGPDGLTVVALSSTDPTSIFRNMMSGDDQEFQMDSEVSDIRIMLANNKELRSQVVLRDNDLDLAFIRPIEKPAEPLVHVDLNNGGTVNILDQVITINRLGKVANRVHSASFERIEAVVERPRRFYIPGDEPTNTANGSPAFTPDGKLVGVFVLRSIRDTGGGENMFGGNSNVTAIILPASDILEGTKQVPAFGEEPAAPPAAPAENAAPADGSAPVEGDAAPADGETAPAQGETAPAEGDAPAEADAAPGEAPAAPAEGEAEAAPAPAGVRPAGTV
jgi:hypothetical protein